ncbi:MAG: YggS family pyridoxal phosphate-dependent enzyme [Candidatus Marinimicrobia bacterium]|jgi:pyridoxal phosphate enzyme (YggS family)|nr:YggS family pyridoxal phosphate-dependent enzyme [Candidatus Neomarinimicrobiota bacterium]
MSLQNYIDRINVINENIRKFSKFPQKVKLIGVTKTFSVEKIQMAINAGIKVIGENKMQESIKKFQAESFPGIERHYIGKLQSNKVNKVLNNFHFIHSLDREKIVKKIDKSDSQIKCLIEVNTSGEKSKGGVEPEELGNFIYKLHKYKSIRIVGLMTISPLTKNEDEIRKSFRNLKELLETNKKNETENIHFNELSMGMTNDYKIALQEGATMIRIGRGVFGSRK